MIINQINIFTNYVTSIPFMIRYLILIVLFFGMQQHAFSQIDTAKEVFGVNALALDENKLSERYPIKLAPIIGLTDKGFAIEM